MNYHHSQVGARPGLLRLEACPLPCQRLHRAAAAADPPVLLPPCLVLALAFAQAEGGYAFFMPQVSLIGPGALQSAGERIQRLGFKKALIVTDSVSPAPPPRCLCTAH